MSEEERSKSTRIRELEWVSSTISDFDQEYGGLALRGHPETRMEITYKEYNDEKYFCINEPLLIEADLIKNNNPELLTRGWDMLHQLIVMPRENLCESEIEKRK